MNQWLRWFQFAVIRNTGLAMLVVVNWQWVNLTRQTAGSFAIDLIPGRGIEVAHPHGSVPPLVWIGGQAQFIECGASYRSGAGLR